MPRRLALSLIVAGLLAVPSAANAASATFFPGESVDSGPGASSPRVDLAQDGTGAVVYVKQDGGVEHVFASRLVGGRWQAPERLDPGLAGPAAQPVVAAGNGGELVVAFVSGGQLYTVVRPAHARSWPAPIPGPPGAASPSIDLSTNGVAYVAWTAAGNVQAARLERGATSFTGIAQPLDVNPAEEAGGLPGEQPKVVVAADGVALVVFGEAGHVFARHIYELRVSTAPQQLDVATLGAKQGAGGDSADVATEADSSYAWAVFRQRLADGTTRTLARRL
ncbi:MAG TPA: hypothetical protein VHB30_02740, partial [Solirubrobacteraceae bacterium]|nr:hypothetical protein [Solirubrobacteraceae bacterium]